MKTRKEKVICILACIFLFASFFVMPVSAEEESEMVYHESYFSMYSNGVSADLSYHLDYTIDDAYDFIDNCSFNEISPDGAYIERTAGEYNYEYFHYMIDDYFDPDAPGLYFGVFTVALSANLVMLPQLDYLLQSAIISAGSLNFFSENVIVDEVRFSLRAVDGETGLMDKVWYSTDPMKISYNDVTWTNSNVIYDYTELANFRNVAFGGGVVLPPKYVLCIDFGFRRSPNRGMTFDYFAFGIEDTSVFSIYNFTGSYQQPLLPDGTGTLIPGIVLPVYPTPDRAYVDELLSYQNNTLDSLSRGNDGMLEVYDSFKLNLASFKNGLLNVSMLLSYFVDDMPSLEFIFIASICLGLVAFLLGLAASIFGAGIRSAKSSSNKGDNKTRANKSSKK